MPIYKHANANRVDVGISQDVGGLPIVGKRGDFDIRHGQLSDGAGSAAVSNYLDDALGVHARLDTPLPIRFGGNAVTQGDIDRLVHAVQIINASLPPDWQLLMPSDDVTPVDPRNGIYVQFVPSAEWPHARHVRGIASSYPSEPNQRLVEIQQGHFGDRDLTSTLTHEIIHVLGIGHVSIGLPSHMEDRQNEHYLNMLHPVDREALRVLFGRLNSDEWPTDFGPWSNTSTHIHGNSPHVGFGVALRNGYAEPWAYGRPAFVREVRQVEVTDVDGTSRIEPNLADWPTDLADNSNLTGAVTWTGHLLGFSGTAPVAGAATIGVDMGTLNGTADFTGLEAWATGQPVGDIGTGATWGDGDLGYLIAIRGNAFKQTGGDTGILTGIFTGNNHKGAGGTLERHDLTAAFGVTR